MAYEYPDPDVPVYDPQGPPVEPPPDPGYDTNPFANQPGGGDVASGLDAADVSYINQTPGLMDYLTKGLGLKPGDIAGLISRVGTVANLVNGIIQGNRQVEALLNSTSQAAQYNKEAATYGSVLNNPNISGPLGSQTWSATPDASGRYTATQSLSPGQQTLLAGTEKLGATRNVLAGTALDQLSNTLSKPFGLGGNVPTVDMNRMGAGIQSDPGAFGPIQGSLDFSGAPAMPIADEALRQKVTDDVMAQQMPAFNKLWDEQVRSQVAQMRAEGLEPGMPGYDAQLSKILDAKGQAFNELERGATAQGLSAMNTRFGENMASRQQGVGEISTQGTFANTAQGQGAEQLLAQQTARNAAQQQGTGQYLAGTATNQAGRGQQFGEYLAGYTMPVELATKLQAGGTPTMPTYGANTPSQVGQASVNPTLAAAGASTANQGITSGVSEFLTRQLPSWYPKQA